jgi:DNA-binding NtrC family response regulator
MIDGVAESSLVSPIGAIRPRSHVQLTGRSAEVTALEQEIDRAARSDAKVLITGESGVGKEIVARAIHPADREPAMSSHQSIALVCPRRPRIGTVGHVKGSFTGAIMLWQARDRPHGHDLPDSR